MIKQPAVPPHSPGHNSGNILANLPVFQKSPSADPVTCSSSLLPQEAVQTQNDSSNENEHMSLLGSTDNEKASEKGLCEDSTDGGTGPGQGQPRQAVVKYECMDIRNEPTLEKGHTRSHKPREEGIYQNTYELPVSKGDNRRSCKADEDKAITDEPDEYEDMNSCGKARASDVRLEYQNFPTKGRMVSGEEPHRVTMRAFQGVCAGVDEENSNMSFDNPDYWHSRLFHKPDAVCT